jgi:protein phosphatase 1 regulatory subunit 11
VCCIYHRPRAVDESSDESSSSSSSSSDSDSDSDGKGRSRDHGKSCRHGRHRKGKKASDGQGSEKRQPSPNAYERVPKPKAKDPGTDEGGKADTTA